MKVAMATGTAAGDEPQGFTPPTVEELAVKFPQLEILGFIGRGGMGAVYKARQKELDRIVALKILPPDTGQDAAFAERFTREARALARLNHPGIITIHEFGRADGLYFFLMEYVDGLNLRDLLSNGRISPREALAIVPQICDALQYAHDQGIVHRDIKPENILLDRRGRVKVADFGLAKLVGGESEPAVSAYSAGSPSLTVSGKIMGTPNYMAPEQKEHPDTVDNRADIYALGVVFYQMLTGELPGKRIEPPSSKVQIDVRLDEVVLRALEKKPELRYQQVSEVKTMVETIVAMAPDPMTPTAQPQPSTQAMNTNIIKSFWRWAVMFVGAAACVTLAVFAIMFLFRPPILIGPSNPGAEDGPDGWWVAANGGARSFFIIDHTDPASGDYDFTLGNTNLDGDNSAERRSVMFPLGPATAGARPITFSFAYKLPDEVNAGDNMLVKLRFFGHATNFISEKNFWIGSRSRDSAMTRYKTMTVGGVRAPRRAELADVIASVNSYGDHWSSGTARFDNFSVTVAPHSLLAKAAVVAAVLGAIPVLIVLLNLFWRWSALALASSPIAFPAQSQPSNQTMNTSTSKSFWHGAVMFAGMAACVTLAVFGIRFLLKTQTILGPPDSDAASAGADWFPDAKGGGSTSVDFNNPATKGGYDFVLNSTVAGVDNFACWRCPIFSVGPAADGTRPISFSFAYKLDDSVAAGNNLRVQLRFWDAAGTNFMGERNIRVGAWTGDSAMTRYRTLTVGGIMAPPNARTIDIAIYANPTSKEPWASGTGRFANISVTTTNHSLLLNTVVGAFVVATIGALIMLMVLFWRRRALLNQSSAQTIYAGILKSFWRGAVMFAGVAACVALAGFAILFLFKRQVMLGPPGSGTSSAIAYWIPDTKGGGLVSADVNDPATRGGCDFVLSNAIAGPTNNADCRCPLFPLGPAVAGKRPITFSFAYKLPDTVAKGNDIHVNLRFFDATGAKFFSQKVILVGAQSGDSGMAGYRTITVTGIKAPRGAQTADVWINANSFDPWWVSGTAQFADISVTTTTYSLLFRVTVAATCFIGIGASILLLVCFWRWGTPAYQ
jgi:serine/threonine protein kinase